MIQTRELSKSMIFNEMEVQDREYWFDFKQKKFLHNIDTFYYSVKFRNDFIADSMDISVKKLRAYFQMKKDLLDANAAIDFLQLDFNGKYLNLRKYSFAHMYTICLECPEWFDLFIAPLVPKGSDGGESLTCELVVQIRSCLLWMYGVHNAFERSYEYVLAIADYFRLEIAFAQENRIDFCWHTNYLSNPEQFFALDNFYKMRVDRFHDALTHTEKVGSSGYEVDYVALGKRSDKVFIRIYLKCKEVIEQGYKGWFLYTWLFHGLINRYDLYVFEECYKRKSWKYLNMARIGYYLEHGQDSEYLSICWKLLNNEITMEEDTLQDLADLLTPKVNLIMNIEYQTMRRHTKSYQLVPFKDNSARGTAQRIYDYLDNRKLVTDYLTFYVFRLVTPDGDVNKSRRDLCAFWKALRSCRMIDVLIPPRQLRLIREYNNKLNADLVKTRAINSVVTYGFYNKGINDDDIMQDVVDALCTLNDNDMQKAKRYKRKKAQQLNSRELLGFENNNAAFNFNLVDLDSGIYYAHNITSAAEKQEDNNNARNKFDPGL